MRAYFGEKPLSNSRDVFFPSLAFFILNFTHIRLTSYSKLISLRNDDFQLRLERKAGFEVLLTLHIFNLSARDHYVCLGS